MAVNQQDSTSSRSRGGRRAVTRILIACLLVVAGVTRLGADQTHAQGPVGTWTSAASMPVGRTSAAAVLLDDGQDGTYQGDVLVVGGINGAGLLSTAELYDPRTNSWTSAGDMNSAAVNGTYNACNATLGASVTYGRYNATAVVLDRPSDGSEEGDVLVVGGASEVSGDPYTDAFASTLLYSPATNTWSFAGCLSVPRFQPTVTLMDGGALDGQVLVAGGANGGSPALASAEIYDPATNTWSITGSMNTARYDAGATTLANGDVLVVGGGAAVGSGPVSTAEIFNPLSQTWIPAGDMGIAARYEPAVTKLARGQVLVAGGVGTNSTVEQAAFADAALYVPAPCATCGTGTWMPAGTILGADGVTPEPRYEPAMAALPDGTAILAGGANSTSAGTVDTALYVPPPNGALVSGQPAGGWTFAGPLPGGTGVFGAFAVALENTACQVFVAGGQDGVGGTPAPVVASAIYTPPAAECPPPPAGGSVSVSPASEAFNVAGASATFTFTNGRASAVNIGDVIVTGRDAGTFTIGANTCFNPSDGAAGTPLAAQGSCIVRVGFTPPKIPAGQTSVGPFDATLALLDTARNTLAQATLTGGLIGSPAVSTGSCIWGLLDSEAEALAPTLVVEPDAFACFPSGDSSTAGNGEITTASPEVDGVSPAFGATAGGTPITITGNGFLPGAGAELGGRPATNVKVVSPTTITATTPSGSGVVPVSVTVPGGFSAVQVVTSLNAGYALRADGTVWAWGYNTAGELGDGMASTAQSYSDTPVQVVGLSNVVAVAADVDTGFALEGDGSVWAWGGNGSGDLGIGCSPASSGCPGLSKIPVRVQAPAGVVRIGSTGFSPYLITADGSLWTWGALTNSFTPSAQIDSRCDCITAPTPYPISGFVQLVGIPTSFGSNATYGLKADGTVWVWQQGGSAVYPGASTAPMWISSLPPTTALASTDNSAYALTASGTVWSWGNNYYGQLGNGTYSTDTRSFQSPAPIPGLSNIIGLSAIATQGEEAFAVDRGGTLWAWGRISGIDDLGLGPVPTTGPDAQCFSAHPPASGCQTEPAAVMTGVAAVATQPIATTGIALARDGSVWNWGGEYPPLSDTPQGSSIPVQLLGPLSSTAAYEGTFTYGSQPAVSVQEASGLDPAVTNADAGVTVTTEGDGTVRIAQYAGNPAGPPSFSSAGEYFDIFTDPNSAFTSMDVTACNLSGGNTMYWWNTAANGGTGGWASISGISVNSTTGCATFTLNANSQPTVGQLTGTIFAVANSPTRSILTSAFVVRHGSTLTFHWQVAGPGSVIGFRLYAGHRPLTKHLIPVHQAGSYRYAIRWRGNGMFALHVLLRDGSTLTVPVPRLKA